MEKTRNNAKKLSKSLVMLLVLGAALVSMTSMLKSAYAADWPTFKVEPNPSTGLVGNTISISVNVYDADDIPDWPYDFWGWQIRMFWDPALLGFVDLTYSNLLKDSLPQGATQTTNLANVAYGNLMCSEIGFGGDPGLQIAFGWLVTVRFEVLAGGTGTIDITNQFTYYFDSQANTHGTSTTPSELYKVNSSFLPPWDEDVNADAVVDVMDLALVAINYGSSPPFEPPRADVDGDNDVDITDLTMVALKYGQFMP